MRKIIINLKSKYSILKLDLLDNLHEFFSLLYMFHFHEKLSSSVSRDACVHHTAPQIIKVLILL